MTMRTKAQIYTALADCYADLAEHERGGAASTPRGNGGAPSRYDVAPGAVASDSELDSEKGDPQIRKDPPRWKGESMVGRRFSECPSAYLDVLAEFRDFTGTRPLPGKDPKYAQYDLKDAARARGWSLRNRGKTITARPAEHDFDGGESAASEAAARIGAIDDGFGGADDDIPFAANRDLESR